MDISDFTEDAARVKDQVGELGRLSPTITVRLAAAAFSADLTRAKAQVSELGQLSPTITVRLSTGTFSAGVARTKGQVSELGRLSPTITVRLAAAAFSADLTRAKAQVSELGQLSPTITVRLSTGTFSAGVARTKGQVSELGRLSPTITVRLATAAFSASASQVRREVLLLGRLSPTITVNLATARLYTDIAKLKTELRALARLSPSILINIEIGQALLRITRVRVALGLLPREVDIRIDIDTSGANRNLGALNGRLLDLRLLAVASRLGIGGITIALGVLGYASGAFVGVLAPLGAALSTMVLTAGALALGFGLIGVAAIVLANSDLPKTRAALQRLKDKFEEVKQSAFKAFEPAAIKLAEFGVKLLDIANKNMPMLGAASTKATDAMISGLENSGLKSSHVQKLLDKLPGPIEDASDAVGTFLAAFLEFTDAAMPQISNFLDKTVEIADNLLRWAESKEGRRQIREFLDQAVPIAEALLDAFIDIGGQLIEFARDNGPQVVRAIENITTVAQFLIVVLGGVLTLLDAIVSAVKWVINHAPVAYGARALAGKAHGGDVHEMAEGGTVPLYTAASGLSSLGAHFVNGPTMGNIGDSQVLYGEALSGANREYAFPIDGGNAWRFITEEPGFDAASFGLWQDLGLRQGYFGHEAASPPASTSAATAPTFTEAFAAPAINPGIITSQLTARHDARSSNNSQAGVESRLETLERRLVSVLHEVRDAAREIPQGVKESMDHNLRYGRTTRTNVLRGLSREARRKVFEGTL